MSADKDIKKQFKLKASKNPDQYYATGVLKAEGFKRKRCKCGTYFWTVSDSDTCGDPACSGGFRFIGKSLVKEKMDYVQVWQKFSKLFKKWGYEPIPRYPVIARWRDDTDFVQASIYDFQPYVVSGEVQPPANPLVVPQFCLRFNDIDNVGITGAHYTGFVMIGQHAFMDPKNWDQAKYFTDIRNWLKVGLGLPDEEITFHEDSWAGGGNFGPCMEYFSRGLELGNQVYMMYEQTPSGPKELKLKVLDMGMGHERNAWFASGTETSYESVFPTVMKKLYKQTGLKPEKDFMKRFIPYAAYLNVDEVDDIDKAWLNVAKNLKMDVKELREKILPLAAMYSVGEHSRSLLVALTDGGLPSNVGGGYNLRVILRRALGFIDKYGWNIDLIDLCKDHAKYLKPLFPELMKNLGEVNKILEVEKNKFESTKQKSRQVVAKIIEESKEKITTKKLMELYDSQGISPDMLAEEFEKKGKKVKVPENFYAKVADMHEKKEQATATVKEEKLDLEGIPETEILYYDDWENVKFKAKIIKFIGKNIMLDKTAFYPTSGGQMCDVGTIQNEKVVEVFKQGNVIVHVLSGKHEFPSGEEVKCEIDLAARKQLTQHHTATHIVNAAARIVLGNHINQAGAKKTLEKAHLDITHYQSISEEEMEQIEKEANKIIKAGIPVKSEFLPRSEAEKKYGMAIYQGGAVPGKNIRVISIPGVDVQACGGTHLKNTADVENINFIKTTKISDSVVRIIFTAGKAASAVEKEESGMVSEAAKVLGCKPDQVPARAQELFSKWKKAKKANKKAKKLEEKDSYELTSTEEYSGDVLAKAADIFKTQPEHVAKTAQRFLSELKSWKTR